MKLTNRSRIVIALVMMSCLFLSPLSVYAKKGEKNYNKGLKYEQEMKWDLAAQEFALALAQLPSDTEYRLHYQRAMFNASQMFMQQGRALEEKNDFVGAYNAYRQAYAYDPVNELALSEMERMVRMQQDKIDGKLDNDKSKQDIKLVKTSLNTQTNGQKDKTQYGDVTTEQRRVVDYTGDLKAFIKEMAKFLNLNVVFDTGSQQFRPGGGTRATEIKLNNVTAAEALDYVFLQEGLFFQKIGRRTIVVAEQNRRPFYQQLVIRTFYLANAKPNDVRTMLQAIIPAQAGRIQTGVVVDPETNSITLRDTAENIRLMGELIRNFDKDRPEVVMDVQIYEVSKDKLLQLGNQIGTETTLQNLGGGYGGILSAGDRGPFGAALNTAAGLSSGLALIAPTSVFSAFERKNNARLLVSTQVHAFNNEESSARIGQRVPVQTASVFPFSNTTPTPSPGSPTNALGGGFPVINFEPIGLTLKFKPIIFPNKDVQVTMSIESKDVFNANTFTPTFIERTITGTARIQNNKTMMLASVAQDRDSRSRKGIPLLGLIPILGRLFSTPTEDSSKTDIVIAVTPRVLRAPDITPRDTQEYESGTMQTPTSKSIADMIREEDREEQLAKDERARYEENAKQIEKVENKPTNVEIEYKPEQSQVQNQAVQLNAATQAQAQTQPQEEAPTYVPAPKEELKSNVASSLTTNKGTQNTLPSNTETVKENDKTQPLQPKPIDAGKATTDLQIKQTSENFENKNAVMSKNNPVAEAIKGYLDKKSNGSDARLSLVVDTESAQESKRKVAVLIDTATQLNKVSFTLRFDPNKIKIHGVSLGNLFANTKIEDLTPLITPDGLFALTIIVPADSVIKGTGVLVFLEVEMLQNGSSAIVFDYNNVRLSDSKKRSVFVEALQDTVVK